MKVAVLVVVAACAEVPAAPAPPQSHRFSIVFDYRFDDGYFSQHPDRRRTLEAAAAVWSELITDDFPEVAAVHEPRLAITDDGHGYRGNLSRTRSGRVCQRWTAQAPHQHTRTPDEYPGAGLGDHNHCRNPDHTPYVWCYTTDPVVRFEACDVALKAVAQPAKLPPIDDLVVFVYAAPANSSKAWASVQATYPGGSAGATLRTRYEQVPFQPWAGSLTINTTPGRPWFFDQTPDTHDDVPIATHYDFYMTAQHELGHILGFLTGTAMDTLIVNDAFVGTHAAAANGGAPVPLAPQSGHLRSGFAGALQRPHLEDLLMSPVATIQGYRVFPSRLEGAMLRDLGYHLNDHVLEKYDPGGAFGGSPYRDATSDRRTLSSRWKLGGTEAAALWLFDDKRHLHGAIRGRPVLFQPATTGSIETAAIEGGIRIREGALLYAEHAAKANCGGADVNCYSVVFDVRLPRLGARVPLFNTNPASANAAEAWIDATGHVGGSTWSRTALAANRWYRVAYAVDLAAGTQTYYVDGERVLQIAGGRRDGPYSVEVDPPRFVLFGSSTAIDPAASPAIDVKRVAFYDRALADADAKTLGGVE